MKSFSKFETLTTSERDALLDTQPSILTPDLIRVELDRLEKQIFEIQSQHSRPPAGSLQTAGADNRPRFYLTRGEQKKYIPKAEILTAAHLAQYEYEEKLLPILEKRYRELARMVGRLEILDSQQTYIGLPQKRKDLVIPDFLPDEEFRELWDSIKYQGKRFREEDPAHYTAKGERVRSKSESQIANLCYYHEVLYRYEYPWLLPKAGIWFPDFTVVNVRTRKVYIWEHFGMEDDPDYAMSAMKKLRIYQENGIWPGEQLIITHETRDKPLTTLDIDAVIEHYLL